MSALIMLASVIPYRLHQCAASSSPEKAKDSQPSESISALRSVYPTYFPRASAFKSTALSDKTRQVRQAGQAEQTLVSAGLRPTSSVLPSLAEAPKSASSQWPTSSKFLKYLYHIHYAARQGDTDVRHHIKSLYEGDLEWFKDLIISIKANHPTALKIIRKIIEAPFIAKLLQSAKENQNENARKALEFLYSINNPHITSKQISSLYCDSEEFQQIYQKTEFISSNHSASDSDTLLAVQTAWDQLTQAAKQDGSLADHALLCLQRLAAIGHDLTIQFLVRFAQDLIEKDSSANTRNILTHFGVLTALGNSKATQALDKIFHWILLLPESHFHQSQKSFEALQREVSKLLTTNFKVWYAERWEIEKRKLEKTNSERDTQGARSTFSNITMCYSYDIILQRISYEVERLKNSSWYQQALLCRMRIAEFPILTFCRERIFQTHVLENEIRSLIESFKTDVLEEREGDVFQDQSSSEKSLVKYSQSKGFLDCELYIKGQVYKQFGYWVKAIDCLQATIELGNFWNQDFELGMLFVSEVNGSSLFKSELEISNRFHLIKIAGYWLNRAASSANPQGDSNPQIAKALNQLGNLFLDGELGYHLQNAQRLAFAAICFIHEEAASAIDQDPYQSWTPITRDHELYFDHSLEWLESLYQLTVVGPNKEKALYTFRQLSTDHLQILARQHQPGALLALKRMAELGVEQASAVLQRLEQPLPNKSAASDSDSEDDLEEYLFRQRYKNKAINKTHVTADQSSSSSSQPTRATVDSSLLFLDIPTPKSILTSADLLVGFDFYESIPHSIATRLQELSPIGLSSLHAYRTVRKLNLDSRAIHRIQSELHLENETLRQWLLPRLHQIIRQYNPQAIILNDDHYIPVLECRIKEAIEYFKKELRHFYKTVWYHSTEVNSLNQCLERAFAQMLCAIAENTIDKRSLPFSASLSAVSIRALLTRIKTTYGIDSKVEFKDLVEYAEGSICMLDKLFLDARVHFETSIQLGHNSFAQARLSNLYYTREIHPSASLVEHKIIGILFGICSADQGNQLAASKVSQMYATAKTGHDLTDQQRLAQAAIWLYVSGEKNVVTHRLLNTLYRPFGPDFVEGNPVGITHFDWLDELYKQVLINQRTAWFAFLNLDSQSLVALANQSFIATRKSKLIERQILTTLIRQFSLGNSTPIEWKTIFSNFHYTSVPKVGFEHSDTDIDKRYWLEQYCQAAQSIYEARKKSVDGTDLLAKFSLESAEAIDKDPYVILADGLLNHHEEYALAALQWLAAHHCEGAFPILLHYILQRAESGDTQKVTDLLNHLQLLVRVGNKVALKWAKKLPELDRAHSLSSMGLTERGLAIASEQLFDVSTLTTNKVIETMFDQLTGLANR